MTAKEKKVYSEWYKEMISTIDEQQRQFELMQEFYEEKGGGKASCCLEANLLYPLTSSDELTRGRALSIYKHYCEAEGRYYALCKLAQGFADIEQP